MIPSVCTGSSGMYGIVPSSLKHREVVCIIHTSILISSQYLIYSLPNDKNSRLKAFADDTLNVNEKLKFGLKRAENIVGKGENAG